MMLYKDMKTKVCLYDGNTNFFDTVIGNPLALILLINRTYIQNKNVSTAGKSVYPKLSGLTVGRKSPRELIGLVFM